MPVKRLPQVSGSVILRDMSSGKEKWSFENNTLAHTTVHFDLNESEGITFEDDPDTREKEIKVDSQTTGELFTLIKTSNFRFAPLFRMTDEAIPIEDQRKLLDTSKLEEERAKIEEKVRGIPYERMKPDELEEYFQENKISHFVDPHFPPRDSSIYDAINDDYPYEQIIQWRRPKEFLKNPKVFDKDIDPNDIKQGFLPDCWILSALSSLAERPELVKRLFITKEYNELGFYKIRLCKNGEWVVVTVDDYIPCYFKAGPIFSRAQGDELWVLLLEKAYAKLHGHYYSLRYGFTHHGMMDLTGCPTITQEFTPDIGEEDLESFWEDLKFYDEQGFLMTCETSGFDDATEGGGPSASGGLVSGHAYSLIDVAEYQDVKLLNIRNPWGKFEWDGAWSDNSEEWTEEMIKAIKPVFSDKDGAFWMSLEDFVAKYVSVNVCQVRNWNEVRFKGKFLKVQDKEDEEKDWVLSKFIYKFRIEEDAQVAIGIHQEDDRIEGAEKRPLMDIGFALLKDDDDDEEDLELVDHVDYKQDREAQNIWDLEAGAYILVPLTTGALLQVPHNAKEPQDWTVEKDGVTLNNLDYESTITDIFRKLDWNLDGQLSYDELNQFGEIVDSDYFKEIEEDDFQEGAEKFKNISSDENGLTLLGFKQTLTEVLDKDNVKAIFEKMGYDEALYSSKSKVFVATVHSTRPTFCKIKNAIGTSISEITQDLILAKVMRDAQGHLKSAQSSGEVVAFAADHPHCYGRTYAAVNQSDVPQKVELDMTDTEDAYFSPNNGTISVVVPPKSVKRLGAVIADPDAEQISYAYTIDAEEC